MGNRAPACHPRRLMRPSGSPDRTRSTARERAGSFDPSPRNRPGRGRRPSAPTWRAPATSVAIVLDIDRAPRARRRSPARHRRHRRARPRTLRTSAASSTLRAVAGDHAGAVHQPDRRRRGADPLPRGRRRRRHRPTVRCPRARGARRGASAAIPALARPHAGTRRPATDDHRRCRIVAVFRPEGRRRYDDDRRQHRRPREPAAPRGR